MIPLALLATLALAGGTVHGTVRTDGSLESVPFARVSVPELNRRTSTDERGRFVLRDLPAGEWRLRVEAIGYATAEHTVVVTAGGAAEANIVLAPSPVELAPVRVRALRSAPFATGGEDAAGPPPIRVDLVGIETAPALAQVDVFRALQTLPSIAPLSDFSTGLYVRGGTADQTLVTLDDVPLFNPYRLGGLFSVVDPGIVSHVEVVPGGVGAAVGDRLGGVIAVRTRPGASDRLHGWGEVGLLSARAGFDGPLGAGSFLLAGRTNYLGAVVGLFSESFDYGASDLYVKAVQPLGRSTEIAASAFVDAEDIRSTGEEDGVRMRWGSTLGSVAVHHMSAGGVRADGRIAWSRFRGSLREEGAASGDLSTGIDGVILAVAARVPVGAHNVAVGAQLDLYAFDHVIDVPDPESFDPLAPAFHPLASFAHRSRLRSVAAWLEDEWEALPSLRVRAGARLLHSPDHGSVVLPRAGARLRLGPSLAVSLAAGRYAQLLYGSRDEDAAFASLVAIDLPVEVPADQGPSTASDVVAGIEWSRGATHARADAYRRRVDSVPLRSLDRRHPPPLLSEATRPGTARAAGIELSLAHGWSGGSVAGVYTLASVEHRVDGMIYAPRHDRRHSAQLTAELTPSARTRLGARAVMASGQPYTPVIGAIHPVRADHAWLLLRPVGFAPALLGEHHSARMPGYFRLDVSARRRVVRDWFGRTTTVTPYVQVLNVLNTRNPLVDVPRTGDAEPSVTRLPQLPILPTLGATWRF